MTELGCLMSHFEPLFYKFIKMLKLKCILIKMMSMMMMMLKNMCIEHYSRPISVSYLICTAGKDDSHRQAGSATILCKQMEEENDEE